MGLITGNEKARAILLREDYNINVRMLPVEQYASDVITIKKNGKRDKSFFLNHSLMKRCYNVPGIPDGKLALLITPRDVLFDPLKQLDDSWKGKELTHKLGEIAKEQQHKAESDGKGGTMSRAQVWLSASAFILFFFIGLIAVIQHWRG